MKQLIEFIPLVIFFALYKMYDIYVGTAALIIATVVSIIASYVLYKKVEKMQWVTVVFVVGFGGLTLFFHDDNFIKWKVTIIYVFFALGLLITHFMGKPLIKGMLSKEISLPDKVWTRINHAWVVFFILCALTNIYVAFNLPLDFWVNFKVFGLSAATLIFTLLIGLYIYKYMPKESESENEETASKTALEESKDKEDTL